MGVRIDGVWHEELADPGTGGDDSGNGRNFDSSQEYNQASTQVESQGGWGENLTTWAGGGAPGTATGTARAGTGAQQYGDAIQKALDALASGNREAFQRAIHEFDVTFGLDKDKFAETIRQFNENLAVTQGGLTGMYQGQATLPALTSYATQFGTWGTPQTGAQTLAAQQQAFAQQQALAEMYGQGYSGFGAIPTGQATLAAQQQAYAQQMGMINQAATLQANPFRQAQALGQMNRLLAGQGVAGFQAPNVVPGVGTAGGNTQGGLGYLQTMIEDIRNPTANQASMNDVLKAIPTPNQLNSTEFLRSAPSSQSMVLQAMQERYGLDPADSLKQIQATLPQFTAPTTQGTLRR